MSLSAITKKFTAVLSEVFSAKEKPRKRSESKYRKLLLDPLEERQLLAVSTVMTTEQFANVNHALYLPGYAPSLSANLVEREAYDFENPEKVYYETDWGQENMAGNNQGDFVMVWSQNDYIWDTNTNNYMINPQTQDYYSNWNVYARYFTDQVQRITIPDNITPNAAGEQRFSLIYHPYETQTLSFTTVMEPYSLSQSNIAGYVDLAFDVNRDGTITENEKTSFSYSESRGPQAMMNTIQSALRRLGPEMADVTVNATSANDYEITFGEAYYGINVPEIQVLSTTNFSSGYLAGAVVTTRIENEPQLLTGYDIFGNSVGILVDPDDPEATANNILTAFNFKKDSNNILSPGVEFWSQENASADSPYYLKETVYTAPSIQVKPTTDPADGRTLLPNSFDITFVDGSGKTVHQDFAFATNGNNSSVISKGEWNEEYNVTVLKQNSDQFRVNAPEIDNPYTTYPEILNQMNAQVAMDMDGNFIITWQGEVRDANNKISTNVYARTYSPQAMITQEQIDEVEFTQENMADGGYMYNGTMYYYTDASTSRYKVNYKGNFVDSNNNEILINGKPFSDHDDQGNLRSLSLEELTALKERGVVETSKKAVQGVRPTSDVFQVNYLENGHQMQPSVGADAEGNFVIAWSNFGQNNSYFSGIYGAWYDREGNRISGVEDVHLSINSDAPKTQSSVALSRDGYVVVTWFEGLDTNQDGGMAGATSLMAVFAPGDYTDAIYRGNIGAGGVYNAQVAFDANNDILVSYSSNPYAGGLPRGDAYAEAYRINTTDNTVSKTRDPFRVTGLYSYSNGTWSLSQTNTVGGFDADGDMVFAYQGYGPDFYSNVSSLPSLANQAIMRLLTKPENYDLAAVLFDFGEPDNIDLGIRTGPVPVVLPDDTIYRINGVIQYYTNLVPVYVDADGDGVPDDADGDGEPDMQMQTVNGESYPVYEQGIRTVPIYEENGDPRFANLLDASGNIVTVNIVTGAATGSEVYGEDGRRINYAGTTNPILVQLRDQNGTAIPRAAWSTIQTESGGSILRIINGVERLVTPIAQEAVLDWNNEPVYEMKRNPDGTPDYAEGPVPRIEWVWDSATGTGQYVIQRDERGNVVYERDFLYRRTVEEIAVYNANNFRNYYGATQSQTDRFAQIIRDVLLPRYGSTENNITLTPSDKQEIVRLLALPENSDINALFVPYLSFSNVSYNTDVDVTIRDYIIPWIKNGASDDQVGRIAAALDAVLGMYRGNGNDIMTTRINKNGTQSSDAVVTSYKDGTNAHFTIFVPKFPGGNQLTSASITLQISHSGTVISIPITLPFNNQVFQPDAAVGTIRDAISNALAQINDNAHSGSPNWLAIVNRIDVSNLIEQLSGTDWEIRASEEEYWIYDVALQNNAHDSQMSFGITGGSYTRRDMQGTFSSTGAFFARTEQYGSEGTLKQSPGISVLPNGSYVVSWVTDATTTSGTVVDRNLNYRYFKEAQDQAGPYVTDAYLTDSSYVKLENTIQHVVKEMIVTFDEELCAVEKLVPGTNTIHKDWNKSVYNIDNWELIDLETGEVIEDAIESIRFGMNESMYYEGFIDPETGELVGDATTGFLSLGSNRWEAIVIFKGEGLADGQYRLVAKKEICDKALNQLGRQGEMPNGVDFTRDFAVIDTNYGTIDLDYGDAPRSYGDAYHIIDQNLKLGPTVMAEKFPNYIDTADADLDDDGFVVERSRIVIGGSTVLMFDVTNDTGKDAWLSVWIDTNQDGIFDRSERVIYEKAENGIHSYSGRTIPNTIESGDYMMRVRLTTDQVLDEFGEDVGINFKGRASDGETEDYLVSLMKPSVTVSGTVFQDVNANGSNDTELPLSGWLVFIDTPDENGRFDGKFGYDKYGEVEPFYIVGVNGAYSFSNLLHNYDGSPTVVRILTSVDDEHLDSGLTQVIWNGRIVRLQDPNSGYRLTLEEYSDYIQTAPVYEYRIVTQENDILTDRNFGFYPRAHITIGDAKVTEGNSTVYGTPLYTTIQMELTMTNEYHVNVGADVWIAYDTVETAVQQYLQENLKTFYYIPGYEYEIVIDPASGLTEGTDYYKIVVNAATSGTDFQEIHHYPLPQTDDGRGNLTTNPGWIRIPGTDATESRVQFSVIIYGDVEVEHDEVFDVVLDESASYVAPLRDLFEEGTADEYGMGGTRVSALAVDKSHGKVLIINDDGFLDYGNIPPSSSGIINPVPFGPSRLDDYGARHWMNSPDGGWLYFGENRDTESDANTGLVTIIDPDPEVEGDEYIVSSPGRDADNDGVLGLVSGTPENGTYVTLNSYTFVAGVENYLKFKVTNTTGKDVYIAGWFDFNQDNAWNLDPASPGYEQFIVGDKVTGKALKVTPDENGEVIVPVMIPSTARIYGNAWIRFRVSTEEYITTGGMLMDGEVEDYLVTLQSANMDHGSAPMSYGDAAHSLVPDEAGAVYGGIHLGGRVENGNTVVGVDGEPSALYGNVADIWEEDSYVLTGKTWGDSSVGYADDDGVLINDLEFLMDDTIKFSQAIYASAAVVNADGTYSIVADPRTPGVSIKTTTIRVKPSEEGFLSLWIDSDGDGTFENSTFDTSERVWMRPAGSTSNADWAKYLNISPAQADQDGYVSIEIYVPDRLVTLEALKTFARFRFTDTTIDPTKLGPTGSVANGEVEDYAVVLVTANSSVAGYVFDDINANSEHMESSPPPATNEITLVTNRGNTVPVIGQENFVVLGRMNLSGTYSIGFTLEMGGYNYNMFRVTDQGALLLVNNSTPYSTEPALTVPSPTGFYGYSEVYIPTLAPFLTSLGSYEISYYSNGRELIVKWTDPEHGNSFGVYLMNSVNAEGNASDDGDFVTFFYDGIPQLEAGDTAEIGINFGTVSSGIDGITRADYNSLSTQQRVNQYFQGMFGNFTYDPLLDRYSFSHRFLPDALEAGNRNNSLRYVTAADLLPNPNPLPVPGYTTNPIVFNTLAVNEISSLDVNAGYARFSAIQEFGFSLEVGGARYSSYRISDDGRIGLVNTSGVMDAFINVGVSLLQKTPVIDIQSSATQGHLSTERGNPYVQIRWDNAFGVYIENDPSGDIISFFWTEDAYSELVDLQGNTHGNPMKIGVDYAADSSMAGRNPESLNIVLEQFNKLAEEENNHSYYNKVAISSKEEFDLFRNITNGGRLTYRFSAVTGYIYNMEPGIQDQTVKLRKLDENGNPEGEIFSYTTRKGENGYYLFTGLYPGDYVVWHDGDQLSAEGYVSTKPLEPNANGQREYQLAASYINPNIPVPTYDFGYFNQRNNQGIITVGDLNVKEGDQGVSYAEVDISLTGSFGVAINVTLEAIDDTARFGVNYGNSSTNPDNTYSYTFDPQVAPIGNWNYKQVIENAITATSQYEQSVSKNTVAYGIYDGKQWKVYIYYQPTNTFFCLTDAMGTATDDRMPSVLETTKTITKITEAGSVQVEVPRIEVVWSGYNTERDNDELYYSEVVLDGDLDSPGAVADLSDLAINWTCLTDRSNQTNYTDDTAAKIAEGEDGDIVITWTGHDNSGRSEIFFIAGRDNIVNRPQEALVRLTENNIMESGVRTNGRYIVWVQDESARKNIYMYDIQKGNTILLTTDGGFNDNPVINAGYIAWEYSPARNDSQTSVLLYRLDNEVGNIVRNSRQKFDAEGGTAAKPCLGEDWMVWEENMLDGKHNIFAFNLQTSAAKRNITPQNNNSDNTSPQVLGNRVVWASYLSEEYGKTASHVIRYADLDTPNFIPITISDIDKYSVSPIITGTGMVVWMSEDVVSRKFTIVTATQDESVVHGKIRIPINGNTVPQGDLRFKLDVKEIRSLEVGGQDYQLAVVNPDKPDGLVTIMEDDGYVIKNQNGVNVGGIDYSDAPASYGTLLVDNAARHAVRGVFDLNTSLIVPTIALYRANDTQANTRSVDVERDGQPSAPGTLANQDNTNISNDENGLAFVKDRTLANPYYRYTDTVQWARNDTIEIDIFPFLNPDEADQMYTAYLHVWIDWNGDGFFDETTEHIILNENEIDHYRSYSGDSYDGTKSDTISITVPADAKLGRTYLRARFSSEENLGVNGWAPDGEVEDYAVTILDDPNKDKAAYIKGDTLYVRGSTLDDYIIVTRRNAVSASDTALVVQSLNSDSTVEFKLSDLAKVNKINIDTRTGNDTVVVNGLAADAEQVVMRPNQAQIKCNVGQSNEFRISIVNAVNIQFDGNGGNDEVTIYDSRGNDIAVLEPHAGSISGISLYGPYKNAAENVKSINMVAGLGGTDEVTFVTRTGDTMQSNQPSTVVGYTDGNYINIATGFSKDNVLHDREEVYLDSTGKILFIRGTIQDDQIDIVRKNALNSNDIALSVIFNGRTYDFTKSQMDRVTTVNCDAGFGVNTVNVTGLASQKEEVDVLAGIGKLAAISQDVYVRTSNATVVCYDGSAVRNTIEILNASTFTFDGKDAQNGTASDKVIINGLDSDKETVSMTPAQTVLHGEVYDITVSNVSDVIYNVGDRSKPSGNKVEISGSASKAETVVMEPYAAQVSAGNYSFTVTNVTDITYDGKGGGDTVSFRNVTTEDVLNVSADRTSGSVTGRKIVKDPESTPQEQITELYVNTVFGVGSITAYASNGNVINPVSQAALPMLMERETREQVYGEVDAVDVEFLTLLNTENPLTETDKDFALTASGSRDEDLWESLFDELL
ncbi:MAG: GEVED domain-containing protein [Planctomycetaceae bacterium]|jgi:hypothetical protein|nr:GEVED domain-containing protein [Planctomycetaceae bacterium]